MSLPSNSSLPSTSSSASTAWEKIYAELPEVSAVELAEQEGVAVELIRDRVGEVAKAVFARIAQVWQHMAGSIYSLKMAGAPADLSPEARISYEKQSFSEAAQLAALKLSEGVEQMLSQQEEKIQANVEHLRSDANMAQVFRKAVEQILIAEKATEPSFRLIASFDDSLLKTAAIWAVK